METLGRSRRSFRLSSTVQSKSRDTRTSPETMSTALVTSPNSPSVVDWSWFYETTVEGYADRFSSIGGAQWSWIIVRVPMYPRRSAGYACRTFGHMWPKAGAPLRKRLLDTPFHPLILIPVVTYTQDHNIFINPRPAASDSLSTFFLKVLNT